jgi:hypothetical protein
MIEINDLSIKMSKGDLFDITFVIEEGLTVEPDMKFTLSIKKRNGREPLVQLEPNMIVGQKIRFTSYLVGELPAGNYIYDISLPAKTLNWIANLEVREVAH